ncbi:MAG: hypothetical protein R3E42_04100 [Burkholderiaceae bacterium]
MSTILNSFSRAASHAATNPVPSSTKGASQHTPSRVGVRGLTVLLLAAAVSALVTVADQYVGVLTDGHLFFGWVVLWAVVFAGMALFADTARTLASKTLAALDRWSQSMAEARAEARLWEIAKSDPRVMAELMAARLHSQAAAEDDGFADALAPMGFDTPAIESTTSGWGRFPERLAASRAHQMHLYYI